MKALSAFRFTVVNVRNLFLEVDKSGEIFHAVVLRHADVRGFHKLNSMTVGVVVNVLKFVQDAFAAVALGTFRV